MPENSKSDDNGRPPPPLPSPTRASSMAAKQIIDTIPSYISLYTHRSSPSATANNPDRTAILRWFSSLSVHHRLSYLTIVDRGFSQLLLLMLSDLRSHGRGTFIVLPDIPSSSAPDLPTLCFRRSRGLLDRIAEFDESERLIRDSVRLFSSKEGESVKDCSCSSTCLDAVSFEEGFVSDVGRFVDAMDRVSDSCFLGSDWGELSSDWVEFEWLKAKGYYSMEAFVANRVEAALRLAWLNSTGGKKRGVKLKEKASSVGVATNVYWRKKGCIDWWEKLDVEVKRKALLMVLGKNTKSLIGEILKVTGRDSWDEMCVIAKEHHKPLRQKSFIAEVLRQDMDLGLPKTSGSCFGNNSSPACSFNGLLVLQEITHMILAFQNNEFDGDKLFFSSLDSVNSLPDCIWRKLRGLLMVLSLDSMKFELFEEDDLKFPAKKAKEKQGSTSRKKKGKNRGAKKPHSALKESGHDCPIDESVQVSKLCQAHQGKDIIVKPDEIVDTANDIVKEEEKQVLIEEKMQAVTRKSRKDRCKSRRSYPNLGVPKENHNSLNKVGITSSSCIAAQSEGKTFSHLPEHPLMQDLSVSSHNSYGSEKNIQRYMLPSNDCAVGSSVDALPALGAGGHAAPAASNLSLERHHNPFTITNEESIHVKSENTSYKMDSYDYTGDTNGRGGMLNEHKDLEVVSDIPRSYEHRNENGTENDSNDECKNGHSGDAESVVSSAYPSYEWPSVAPFRISSFNSHYLPPATDRLHLEVGHNWRSHFQQSSLQQIHQTGNSSVEAGGNIMSQPLPLGLDWPPTMRSVNRLASSLSCNYDSRYLSRRQSVIPQSFGAHNPHFGALFSEDDRKYSSDFVELSDLTNTQELSDEFDNNWLSEEEFEMHTISCIDYNQHFGGGVMYWNPSDYPGTGFSRPPSLSSDDSSWAWREADMNRTVDDMVAFPSSYSTNGLHSPSTAPFGSPFESLGQVQQAVSYARPGMDVNNKIMHPSPTMTEGDTKEDVSGDSDAKSPESLPYPILRPIIIPNISRERSRSDFKRNHDLRSPCVPPNRRERPRVKRPPSPVVLCVPHASRPPTPSPVSDSRKHRGFPTVRSGSSSPRNWGVRGWFPDAMNFDETCGHIDVAEVVWPTWGSKKLSAHQLVQPLTGTLLQEHLIAISQLTHDQEHPDITIPLQLPELLNCPTRKASLPLIHNHLHEEIDSFCKKVASENLMRRPYINWAVKRVTRSLQVLWPRSRTNVFGSNATGLSLPTSDVDLVVCLPPVRNLEPIKEAGILEGRNGIKETCLQHAARYLANQEWVKSDSLKTVENTAIPIIMLVVDVPYDFVTTNASSSQRLPNKTTQVTAEQDTSQTETVSPNDLSSICLDLNQHGKDATSVRLDISFKTPSHSGLQTTQLVKELTEQFPAVIPLALVLKKFLADRSLDHAYSGGLSSYCLVLLITRFLQHEHHLGRAINQNLGGLLMDFLYFFGNVFDPRQMRISIQGSGLYINREKGYSIDPIYIDDPLFPTNNVGKNCFRIHQCIKAFADAYSILENELNCLANDIDMASRPQCQLLQKIIPSISLL
ncbi:hypothetical protein V2J09_018282 [Rumex salicifolius]